MQTHSQVTNLASDFVSAHLERFESHSRSDAPRVVGADPSTLADEMDDCCIEMNEKRKFWHALIHLNKNTNHLVLLRYSKATLETMSELCALDSF